MVGAWELDDPPPWKGDPQFGLEHFFEPPEIPALVHGLDQGLLTGFEGDLGVTQVMSIDEKPRLIVDVFAEGHLEGLPGAVGFQVNNPSSPTSC